MNRPRWAIVLWLTTMALVAVATAMVIATLSVDVPDSWGFRGSASVFAVACGSVGAIVVRRRPDNITGWMFSAIGLLFGVQAILAEYIFVSVLVVPGGLPATGAFAWILVWLWVPAIGMALIFLPLLFPTGRLPSRRWRLLVAYGLFALVIFGAANAFVPGPVDQAQVLDNPLGATSLDTAEYDAMVIAPTSILFAIAVVAAAGSLIIRFGSASGDLRQQIKWFALAILGTGAIFAIYGFALITGAPRSIVKALEMVFVFGLVSIPTAAGMAILRYRLYEIDRIISRTIGWAIVTGLLVGTFALLVVGLQAVIEPLTGGNTLAIAGSTLVVAALFAPLRSRVQRAVDRRFDRSRYDGERLLAAFGERLRDEVDLVTISRDARATVDAAVRPTSVGLWLRGSGGGA